MARRQGSRRGGRCFFSHPVNLNIVTAAPRQNRQGQHERPTRRRRIPQSVRQILHNDINYSDMGRNASGLCDTLSEKWHLHKAIECENHFCHDDASNSTQKKLTRLRRSWIVWLSMSRRAQHRPALPCRRQVARGVVQTPRIPASRVEKHRFVKCPHSLWRETPM